VFKNSLDSDFGFKVGAQFDLPNWWIKQSRDKVAGLYSSIPKLP